MKNNTIITITNVNGSKSFTLGQLAKQIIRYILLFAFLLMIVSALLIFFLSSKIDEYKVIQDKYHDLLVTNSNLEMNINKKETELLEIQEKVSDIEEMIGLEPKEGLETTSRLDIAEVDAQERILMLRSIPSGYPVQYNGVTSRFGWRTNPIQKKKQFHTGIDQRAKMNTPVYATADGIVEVARSKSKIGYGKLLVLNHVLGFKSLYAHLNKIKIGTGEFVKKGQIIGYSGNTGYSSGPHLHYEVRYIGVALNPKNFMDWDLKNYGRIFEKEKRVKWESLAKGIKWQWTLLKQLSSQKEPKLQARSTSGANYMSMVK
jgi:hypothetical protein